MVNEHTPLFGPSGIYVLNEVEKELAGIKYAMMKSAHAVVDNPEVKRWVGVGSHTTMSVLSFSAGLGIAAATATAVGAEGLSGIGAALAPVTATGGALLATGSFVRAGTEATLAFGLATGSLKAGDEATEQLNQASFAGTVGGALGASRETQEFLGDLESAVSAKVRNSTISATSGMIENIVDATRAVKDVAKELSHSSDEAKSAESVLDEESGSHDAARVGLPQSLFEKIEPPKLDPNNKCNL